MPTPLPLPLSGAGFLPDDELPDLLASPSCSCWTPRCECGYAEVVRLHPSPPPPVPCGTCAGEGGAPASTALGCDGPHTTRACPTCGGEGVVEGEPSERDLSPRFARLGVS